MAHFNGDGRQQLLLVERHDPLDVGSGHLAVIGSTPSGTPSVLRERDLQIDDGAGVSVADVNRNGTADVVVGGGEGVQALTSLAPGPGPAQLLGDPVAGFAVADFDRDGIVNVAWAPCVRSDPSDLFEPCASRPGLQLSLRRPDGSFGPSRCRRCRPVPGRGTPRVGTIAAGNLNNDGLPDLAVLRDALSPSGAFDPSADVVTFLAGDGAGGLTRIGGLGGDLIKGYRGLRLIDLDGDGDDDLVFGGTEDRTVVYQNRSAFGTTNDDEARAAGRPSIAPRPRSRSASTRGGGSSWDARFA